MDDMLAQSLRGDIRLKFDLAEALWPVEVDVSQMQVVLINLAGERPGPCRTAASSRSRPRTS